MDVGAGRVAQVEKSLPSKGEALSSNPIITKKKKKTKMGIPTLF
jgi:hypothetical protein